jgi:hypothetical protein
MNNEANINYTDMTNAVTTAVKGDIAGTTKWMNAGSMVRGFYGTETAIAEVKAQFIADAIIPAMDKKHATALGKELPRKGSTEFNAMDEGQKDNWEVTNQAKKDARAIAHTMYSRIVRYAFPTEKTETVARSLKTRISEELSALIKACEKSEDEDFDVLATINNLRATLALINT